MNEFTFSVPQNIIVGSGTMAKLPEIAKKLGGSHALIISGPNLERLGLVKKTADYLEEAGIAVDSFTETEANPSVETVEGNGKISVIRRRFYWGAGRRIADGCVKGSGRAGKIRRQHHGV